MKFLQVMCKKLSLSVIFEKNKRWFHLLKYLAYFITSLELFSHNSQSAGWYIIAWVHSWIGWGYYGHMLKSIPEIPPWVPHCVAQRGHVLNLAQHDRVGPPPVRKNPKKTRNQHARQCIWIQLADAGHQQGPVYSTKKARYLKIIP